MSDWQVARLRELKEFKEEHGHCNVPHNYSGGLYNWVIYRRYLGKEDCRRLDPNLLQKLEELDFRWDTAKRTQLTRWDKAKRTQLTWEERFQQLKEFKEEHGHCKVPRRYPGGLGVWTTNQRRGGKEGTQRRNAEQTRKLEELGFRWETATKRSWDERFQQLKEFKEEHGHCNVPRKHPGGLYRWVAFQRSKSRSQRCDASQTQKLEELGGFRWRENVKDCKLVTAIVGTWSGGAAAPRTSNRENDPTQDGAAAPASGREAAAPTDIGAAPATMTAAVDGDSNKGAKRLGASGRLPGGDGLEKAAATIAADSAATISTITAEEGEAGREGR